MYGVHGPCRPTLDRPIATLPLAPGTVIHRHGLVFGEAERRILAVRAVAVLVPDGKVGRDVIFDFGALRTSVVMASLCLLSV